MHPNRTNQTVNKAGISLIQRPVARRRLAGGLIGGAALTLLTAPRAAVGARHPARQDAAALPAIAREWAAAWSAHDEGAALAALYTGDATHEEVPSGTVFTGPEAIAAYAASHFAAFPDVALTLSTAFATDDWAAAEWTYGGTYTGSLAGLPPGTGQPFLVHGAVVLALDGDRIRRSASYFDFYSLLIQLGVLAAPGSATPSA